MLFTITDVLTDENESYSEISKLPDFRYEEIKSKIAKCMEFHEVKNIPFNVFKLAKKMGIKLVKFSELTQKEFQQLSGFGINFESAGFLAIASKNGKIIPFIYYNDAQDSRRIRFTILHEIGHFILGHLEQSDLAEAEANFFAKYFIAPPVLIDRINPSDYMQIACVFNLSNQCAWNSFDYYTKWKKHHYKNNELYESYEEKIINLCCVKEGILDFRN
ncbi:MAG: ImmA/IrrE family metallo-endopeptidase [Treponema sp.]|jgi:Zn-dependent peptidase ImmA (M78 family)|nr:ImmA/IrrE family metallo-endopeptidase [Treponema sp.]